MKETFYFSHDYNVRIDDKIKRLIRKLGYEWYWLYWALIEDMYNNAEAMHLDCEGIAYDMRVDEKTIKSLISDFDLFIIDWDKFYSKWVIERLEQRNKKSATARESAMKRWNKKNATVMQSHSNSIKKECDSNAIKESKVKESKIKEKKVKEIIIATKVATPLKDLMINNINKNNIIKEYNSTDENIKKEMMDFYLYWSEKKPNWKKELWQMQKTFDVSRRFNKWLSNSAKWNKSEKKDEESLQVKLNNMTYEEKEQRMKDLWIL